MLFHLLSLFHYRKYLGQRQGNGADEGKTEKRKLKKAKPPSGGFTG